MEILTDVLVGADPEVFVADGGPEGLIVSVIGKLGGTKTCPLMVDGGGLQEDNVLAEFNIDPAKTKLEFVGGISKVMHELARKLSQQGLNISVKSSHEFDMDYLIAQGPQALEFGCGTEWSAYTGKALPKPAGEASGLRTAGGHIHVGYFDPWEDGNQWMAQMLDIILGVPSVLVDKDKMRRKLYGSAGSIRHKPYGVEYRSLSNFWLANDNLKGWVYDQVLWAAANLPLLEEMQRVAGGKDRIQNIINSSDESAAKRVVSELNLEIP